MMHYKRLFEARGVMLISQVLGLDDNVSVYICVCIVYTVYCVCIVYTVYCVCIVYTVYCVYNNNSMYNVCVCIIACTN